MSQIIDSLFVELGLKNEKFKKGIKESEKAQSDFEDKSKKHATESEKIDHKAELEKKRRHTAEVHQHKETLENYKKMREDLIKFFLIFTAGKELGEFISEVVSSSIEMAHLSKQTNVAVENISGLGVAFKEVGGSAEEANDAIRKASEANADFFSGHENAMNKGMMKAAGGLDISLKGAYEQGNPLALMMKQADIIKKASEVFKNNPGEVTRRAAEMGISGHQLSLYSGGGADLMKKIQHGASMSGMNEHKAKIAEEFNKEWIDVLERFKAVGVSVLMPTLQEVTKWLGNKDNMEMISDGLKDLVEAIRGVDWKSLGSALSFFAKALIIAVDGLSKIVSLVNGDVVKSDDLNLITSQQLPDFMRKIMDRSNIFTGQQPGVFNPKSHTTTYHIGTQNIVVPENVTKDRKSFVAFINAAQANTGQR